MRRLRCALTVMALAAVCVSPSTAAAAKSDDSADDANDSNGIDSWVEQRMAAHGIPGAAVAVVRGGRVVHLAGYGTAGPSGAPVTPDTAFLLGSVSKPFTAVLIGQLVKEGVLAWDEPVWPYLADLVDAAPDGFEEVTVEQLLTHTAGLRMSVGVAGAVTIHTGRDVLERRAADVLSSSLGTRQASAGSTATRDRRCLPRSSSRSRVAASPTNCATGCSSRWT